MSARGRRVVKSSSIRQRWLNYVSMLCKNYKICTILLHLFIVCVVTDATTGVIREMMCTRKDEESIYMHLQSFIDDANGLTLPRKF